MQAQWGQEGLQRPALLPPLGPPPMFWGAAELEHPSSGAPGQLRSPSLRWPLQGDPEGSPDLPWEPNACRYPESTHTRLPAVPGGHGAPGAGRGGLSSPVAPRRPPLAESAQGKAFQPGASRDSSCFNGVTLRAGHKHHHRRRCPVTSGPQFGSQAGRPGGGTHVRISCRPALPCLWMETSSLSAGISKVQRERGEGVSQGRKLPDAAPRPAQQAFHPWALLQLTWLGRHTLTGT